MYHNATLTPVDEWVCEDDAILDILGEPTHLGRYYVLSDGFRLLTTMSQHDTLSTSTEENLSGKE